MKTNACVLLGCALISCSSESQPEPAQPVEIRFEARVGADPFSCEATYAPAGPFADPFQVSDLRLYVHDVTLIRADGQSVPLALTSDGRWQGRQVALLDFEDGGGACDNGTAEKRTLIEGTAPPGDYRGVSFRIGVPFDDNHADPVRAEAPLGLMAMHWNWQGGYKFLRFEARSERKSWHLHVGSTGCEGTIGAIRRCARGNRPQIKTLELDFAGGVVTLDVLSLLAELPAEAESCMAAEDDPHCAPAFAALGLDQTTGESARAAAFARVEARP